jgi:hypothetical protein
MREIDKQRERERERERERICENFCRIEWALSTINYRE